MKIKLLAACSAFLLLTGCAGLQLTGTPEERVAKRAEAQMNAFLQKDYEQAYTYMSPGYRNTHSLHRFASDFTGMANLQGFDIGQVECESEVRCEAVIHRQQKAPPGILGTSNRPMILPLTSRQTWVLVNGTWYHYKR